MKLQQQSNEAAILPELLKRQGELQQQSSAQPPPKQHIRTMTRDYCRACLHVMTHYNQYLTKLKYRLCCGNSHSGARYEH